MSYPVETDEFGRAIPPKKPPSEKTCERCHQPIRKGEGYAETDIGSGKWVHWPTCPPSARVIPEKTTPQIEEEIKVWRLWFTTPMGFEAFLWQEAKTREEAEKEARKWVPEGSELRYADMYDEKAVKALLHDFSESELEAVARGTPCAVEAYLHVFRTEKVPILVQRVAKKMLRGENPGAEKPLGEVFIVDGLTLKDYYDLRDLRLLLMGLEKELIGKYGIIEAEPLSSKVRELIKKKIEQVTSKIGSSPETHHSNEENLVARYNYCVLDKKDKTVCMAEILDHLIADEIKAQQEYRQLLELLPEHKTKILEIMGDEATHEKELRQILMQVTQKTVSLPEHVEGSSPEHHSSPVSREEAEAEINVLIDNIAEAIKKGGEIPDYLRQALKKNFMFFKSNPGFPPQYTDFENWLKKAQDMTMEQFKALPQERKDFIYGLFKSQWGNPYPSVSSGDSILRPPF